jgi:hypothetical protein
MQIFGKTGIILPPRARTNILSGVMTLALLAVGSAQTGGQETGPNVPPGGEGQQLMRRATVQLASCRSLQLQLRQQVNVFDKNLVGSGVYLQQQTEQGLALRLELKLRVDQTLTSLLQVSDGQAMWLRRDLPGGASLGRVDLTRIRAELSNSASAAPVTLPTVTPPIGPFAVGGLPRLLAGLEEHFTFAAPQPARFADSDVWLLEGSWQPSVLARLLPDQQERILNGQTPDLDRLPSHLPTDVQVVLRQTDLAPLRIDYRRISDARGAEAAGDRSLLCMEFYDIRHDIQLDERLFTYQPGTQDVQDLTDRYLEELYPTRGEDE